MSFFFFNDPATTEIYTLSLHDALPISRSTITGLTWPWINWRNCWRSRICRRNKRFRSEEHTSELQSHSDLVCRLLLEKKKKQRICKHSISKNAHNDAHRSRSEQ